MPNPKFTKTKFESILLALVQGFFIGLLIVGAFNYLLGTHLNPLFGAVLGVIGGGIYGFLPGSSDGEN